MSIIKKIEFPILQELTEMLNDWEIQYDRIEKPTGVSFVFEDKTTREVTIDVSRGTCIVRIRTKIIVMPDIVIDKKFRLYEACNIINSKSFLKATLDHSEVRFSYEIPAQGVTEGLRSIVANVLHCYQNEIDVELFRVAIQTKDDLYSYYNNKMEAEFRASCNDSVHNPGFHLGEDIPEEDKPDYR